MVERDEQKERVLNDLMWSEYTTGKLNNASAISDFELALEMLECKRTEKDYDWMSDIFIPEFPSIMLTEASHEATQYFSSRDFVEVFLEGNADKDMLACKVAKKIINLTLNNKDIYHYQKYMQARDIIRLMGHVYAICWWEQNVKTTQVGEMAIPEAALDEMGNPVLDPMTGQGAVNVRRQPIIDDVVLYDRFNWMPVDPRNVFPINNKYVYSAQQEDGIIIRSEHTYQDLKAVEKENSYINLDVIKGWITRGETETSLESYNKDEKDQKAKGVKSNGPYDILEFYGKRWAIVTQRDALGFPVQVVPGYDTDGEPVDGAEYVSVRHTMAYNGSSKVTIRFQAEPLRDGVGRPYMPIIRGLCYVHPTKKQGMSSAKYMRESQVALNDTINLGTDRVKLATLPTFIGNKYMVEDNDTVYIEPEHTIEIEDPAQFRELEIKDNIRGALEMSQMFKNSMEQISAIYPTTMGDPGSSGVTATATVGSEQRSNVRHNYKSLTNEYTFLTQLYWMVLQMTWQFMHPKTQETLFTPEERQAFNPVGDYTYQPITSKIEVEHSKDMKVKNYDQIVGRIAGLAQGNPAIIPIIAYIIGRQLDLMGEEYRTIEPLIKKLMGTPMQPEPGAEAPAGPGGAPAPQPTNPEDPSQVMTSNQYGMDVDPMQQFTRTRMQ